MTNAVAAPEGEVALTTLSPSRITTAQKCGLAFEYQYVRHIPAPTESAAMMFGNVMHDATHAWYGNDDAPNDHKAASLVSLVREQWPQKLPKKVWAATAGALNADAECSALEQAIVAGRGCKGPRQTKDFLTSSAWKSYQEKLGQLLDACDAIEEIRWPKDENPLQAYNKSLKIAAEMEARWKNLPRPIAVERPFLLEFEGFTLRGRIDQFRIDPDPNGEVLKELVDLKSGRNLHSQMAAFIQAWIYGKACEQWDDLPVPDYVTFYMLRHNKMQRGKLRVEHDRLALRVLNSVCRKIITADFEPHYGYWCERCDFRDLCSAEIGLWPVDTDGFVLDAP